MQGLKYKIFDVVKEMETGCNYGHILGKKASKRFRAKIDEEGPNTVWHISIINSMCSHYSFFRELLPPILEETRLPKNVAFAIDSFSESDKTQILSGIGSIAEPELLSEDQAVDNIIKSNRFFTLVNCNKDNDYKDFLYVGTREEDHKEILKILDLKGALTINSIKSFCSWTIETVNKYINALIERKQILTYGDIQQKTSEPKYISVAYLIINEGYNGIS